MSVVKPPYLPPKAIGDPIYTLMLDLDETLIHSPSDHREPYYLMRPHCNQFLTELSQHFEIVTFTAAIQHYADWVVDSIDGLGIIKHRLYRQHCTVINDEESELIKDLRLLGRDIKKTVIIDNI